MSGVDAEISLVFVGKNGRTPPLRLRKSQKSVDGKKAEVHAYYLDCDDDVDYLGAVEILNEGRGIFAAWEIQKIVVDKIIEGGLQSVDYWTRHVFPCYGWVKPNQIRCFFEGTASLPQKTPMWLLPSRRREIELNRATIEWEKVTDLPSRAACANHADVPWDERLPTETFKSHKVATAEYLESRGMGKLLGLSESWKDLDEDNTGAGTLHGDLYVIPTEKDKDGDGEDDEEQAIQEELEGKASARNKNLAGNGQGAGGKKEGKKGEEKEGEGGKGDELEEGGGVRPGSRGNEEITAKIKAAAGKEAAAAAKKTAAEKKEALFEFNDDDGEGGGGKGGGTKKKKKRRQQFKNKLPLPPCSSRRNPATYWTDDGFFARQAVQGIHPNHIKVLDSAEKWPQQTFRALNNVRGVGVEAPPETSKTLERLLPYGRTLEDECENGRVFIADYRVPLEGMNSLPPPGSLPDQWHVPKPVVLYYCAEDPNRERGHLPRDIVVVAVNIDPDAEEGGEVFTPDDGAQEWALAKAHVSCADAQVHLVCSWYFRCHVCMEPMAVSMRRNMSTMHPVYKLLRPYLRHLIPACVENRDSLFAVGSGILPCVLAVNDQVTRLCKEEYKRWVIQETGLPFDLEARGFNGTETLEEYPYRDDGKLIWQAMFAYVGEYLRCYYKADFEVLEDNELVAWWREVTDVGFPGYNWGDLYEIDDVPELQFALTTIMWTLGPQSSALSGNMYGAYAFPPARPTTIRGKPHKRGVIGAGSFTQFLERMPDKGATTVMAGWAKTMTDGRGLGQPMLGAQREEWVTDTMVVKKYREFQHALEEAQKLIDLRNEHRLEPYTLMDPEKITCGVIN